MRVLFVGLPLLMMACSSSESKDKATDPTTTDDTPPTTTTTTTEPTTTPDCVATVASTVPADDAVQVDASLAAITITFSEPLHPTDVWSVNVASLDGEIGGDITLSADSLTATFSPTNPFEEATLYTISTSLCEVDYSASFTTYASSILPEDINNKTYGLNFGNNASVNITEPGNAALIQSDLVPIDWIIVQTSGFVSGGDSLNAYAATGYEPLLPGDPPVPSCEAAISLDANFSDNPVFDIGPENLDVPDGYGGIITLEDFQLTGQFSEDGIAIENVTLYALVDTSIFPPLYVPCDNPAIQLLMQPTCVPCTTAPSGQCMIVEGTAASAPALNLDLAAECPVL